MNKLDYSIKRNGVATTRWILQRLHHITVFTKLKLGIYNDLVYLSVSTAL
jgi:hypothetical protein